MNRPTGWQANPQAMASVSLRTVYQGHPELGVDVDADTWLTPRFILDSLGAFDLDPCATAQNPKWVAPKCYTAVDDGLNQPWSGRVFCNPPYSNTIPWVHKCADHANGVTLIPASVESKVWREVVWMRASALLFLAGRTRFCNPDGSATRGRPLRSVVLIAWTDEDAKVICGSGLAGVTVTRWNIT